MCERGRTLFDAFDRIPEVIPYVGYMWSIKKCDGIIKYAHCGMTESCTYTTRQTMKATKFKRSANPVP